MRHKRQPRPPNMRPPSIHNLPLLQKWALEWDPDYTGRHTRGVDRKVQEMLPHLSLSPEESRNLRHATPLHDLGKIRIPQHLLRKPGSLSEEEHKIVKGHPRAGAEMVAELTGLPDNHPIIRAIREHHKPFSDEKLPISNVLTAADGFVGTHEDRPYHNQRTVPEAMAELIKWSGKKYDPKMVAILLTLEGEAGRIPKEELDRLWDRLNKQG